MEKVTMKKKKVTMMELIHNEKLRKLTFKKRKQGLMTKLHEFTTLCDVSACMVIYDGSGAVEPEIWPPRNPDEVRRMIDLYKAKSRDIASAGNYCKTYGLTDYFEERGRKIEEELAKLKKKNQEAKYPTDQFDLSFQSETHLRQFAAALNNKAQNLRSRIEFLKRNKRMRSFNLGNVDFGVMSSRSHLENNPPLNPFHYYAPPPPLQYIQYAVGDGVAPPQFHQFYPMAADENVDIHLQDLMVPPQHYMQYAVVDGVAPPPQQQLQFQPPDNIDRRYDGGGLEDILQYY